MTDFLLTVAPLLALAALAATYWLSSPRGIAMLRKGLRKE